MTDCVFLIGMFDDFEIVCFARRDLTKPLGTTTIITNITLRWNVVYYDIVYDHVITCKVIYYNILAYNRKSYYDIAYKVL